MKNRFFSVFGYFLLILIFLTNSFLFSLDPRLLKGTYNPLEEKYKKLSPIHGAILRESGVLWNYYKFGDDKDPQIQLIKDLYHEHLGAFLYSRSKNRIAAHLSVNLIGKIIGTILNENNQENLGKILCSFFNGLYVSFSSLGSSENKNEFVKNIRINKK